MHLRWGKSVAGTTVGWCAIKTHSFALIVDDPDAPNGTFTHWVLFDIPKSVQSLDAGQPMVGIAGDAEFRAPASWGQGERGAAGYEDHGTSETPGVPPTDRNKR